MIFYNGINFHFLVISFQWNLPNMTHATTKIFKIELFISVTTTRTCLQKFIFFLMQYRATLMYNRKVFFHLHSDTGGAENMEETGAFTLHHSTELYIVLHWMWHLHCPLLNWAVVYCTALRCSVLHWTELWCTALHWAVVYCTALSFSVLHCTEL